MKLYKTLEVALKKEPNYVTDNGELKKWVVINKAQNYDAELIGLLLDDKELKAKFFLEIKGVLVFNQSLFVQFLEQKNYLNDSYTIYKNNVGLNVDGRYLKQLNEVTLVWPFKDCVLEGGQSREEDKREEIFFNETLAQDEITQLLEPKVLTNPKRFSSKGEESFNKFNRNIQNIITDNLIIKGNNLLALHTLNEEFNGKIKLIYIDPPYNTGNDGFKYNDSFNRSTWLTFMRNRLSVAKNLLSEDGFIAVQCDDNEQAYLKILLDEVFQIENYRNSIFWHRTYAGKTVSKNLPWNTDIIHTYSKNVDTQINNVTSELNENDIDSFKKDDNDGRGKYNTVSLQKTGGPGPQTTYDYIDNTGRTWKCPVKGWRMKQSKLRDLENDNRLYITDKTIREKYYLSERLEIGKQIDNFWGDIGNLNRVNDQPFEIQGQKPEKLIQRIIELFTSKGEIVLDYHLGSGTTCAVAHKLERQYIGVEQMDYIETFAVERLKTVIEGEESGISKNVNWKGGGEFIYFELKKYNQTFIDKIQSCKSSKGLLKIWEEMKVKSFLNYNVDLQKQEAHIEEFRALTLEEQKQHLVELLDKNQLYVNLSSLNDKDFAVSAEEKKATKEFYQIKDKKG
jgi:adenine-specific DNA-methyltransferase